MAHYNPEVADIVASSNDKVTPGFNIDTVTNPEGHNVTLAIVPHNGLAGLQVEVEVKRITNPITINLRVIQPEISGLISELKETLDIFERLIDEGLLNGSQANIELLIL